MNGEQLGLDDITDLLAIADSTGHILGHKMGPRALEAEDRHIRPIRVSRCSPNWTTNVGTGAASHRDPRWWTPAYLVRSGREGGVDANAQWTAVAPCPHK